jgi:hypothetical protein
MIVVGSTPQPDAALKILTPWWDVLCRYLTAGIMTIALTATALQAAKDNLICIPAVDCTSVSSPHTPTALKLRTDVCDKVQYQVVKNDSTATILTTMNDYRQYSFVDSACFQKILQWYPAYFPFILVVEALVLLVIDNFWIMYPKTSSALSHFVALVMDCYSSVGTLSDILQVISKPEGKSEETEEEEENISSKESKVEDVELAVIDPGKTPKVSDEPSGSQTPQASDEQDNGEFAIPLSMTDALKVKTLYERVESFKKWYDTTHTLMSVYVLRGVLQIAFSLTILIFNSYYYSDLGDSIDCRLKEVFLMKYEYFVCSRFIAPFYRAFTLMFAIPVGTYFLISVYAFFWTFKNSERFNLYSGVEFVDDDLNVKGDMAFLFSLLEQYDKLYSVKLSLFLSPGNKGIIYNRVANLYRSPVHEEWSLFPKLLFSKPKTVDA